MRTSVKWLEQQIEEANWALASYSRPIRLVYGSYNSYHQIRHTTKEQIDKGQTGYNGIYTTGSTGECSAWLSAFITGLHAGLYNRRS